MLQDQGLLFVPEALPIQLISRQHNNPLAGHFDIKNTQKLLARKYYWPTLRHNVKGYVKGCDVCLALKTVRYKLYDDLQYLLILTHRQKDLFIDFVTSLPILVDWKKNNYDSILVIVNWLIKMVYCKPVKTTIDAPGLAEVIIDVVV